MVFDLKFYLLLGQTSNASFFEALGEHAFLQHALIAGLLVSVACGITGSFVVVRRISYITGGIAHCVLGGIGAALFLQHACGYSHAYPTIGAIVAALSAAMIIGLISLYAKQREDTVIGATWAVGMAAGILFLSRTPGYNQDLMSYLFGNVLMISSADLLWIAGLDVVIVLLTVCFYKPLLVLSFDEEFARVRGLRVNLYYLFLMGMIALTVVLLVSVVGVILVIAMLTLPVAAAGRLSRRLWQMMLYAIGITMVLYVAGLMVSYDYDFPTGATTVLLSGIVYLVTLVGGACVAALRRG